MGAGSMGNRLGAVASGAADKTVAAFVKPQKSMRCAGNADALADA